MKVLTTSGLIQTFKVIPREYVTTATAVLTDDSTKTVTTYTSLGCTTSDNHLSVPITFSPVLVEGRYYDLVLKNSSDKIIYLDKIFCTDQGVDQEYDQEYTINKNEYTSDTSFDNDFIII